MFQINMIHFNLGLVLFCFLSFWGEGVLYFTFAFMVGCLSLTSACSLSLFLFDFAFQQHAFLMC